MKEKAFVLEDSIDILRRTPATLNALLKGVDPAWDQKTEGAGTFSPFDVVGHLIDGEETDWLHRVRLILEQGPEAVFEPYDRFRHQQRNSDRSLDSLLDEFESLRAANVDELSSLSLDAADLDRKGRHPDFGEVSLRQLIASWVVHDLGHIAQITRVMSGRYKEEVGPWHAYLPVLHARIF